MKKKIHSGHVILIILGLLVLAVIMSYNVEKYKQETKFLGGFSIPNSAVYLEGIDTHGGMMGDGEYFAKIQLSKDSFDKLYDKILKANEWTALPIAEDIAITKLYGGEYNGGSYGTLEISKKIPQDIKNGIYYYKDIFAELYPDDPNIIEDDYISGNYIVSVLDSDKNLLYIYRYDS